MPPLPERVQQWVAEIARDWQPWSRVSTSNVAASIANQINELRWEKGNTALTPEEKLAIVDDVARLAKAEPLLAKAADNQNFLDLVQQMKNLVGK